MIKQLWVLGHDVPDDMIMVEHDDHEDLNIVDHDDMASPRSSPATVLGHGVLSLGWDFVRYEEWIIMISVVRRCQILAHGARQS